MPAMTKYRRRQQEDQSTTRTSPWAAESSEAGHEQAPAAAAGGPVHDGDQSGVPSAALSDIVNTQHLLDRCVQRPNEKSKSKGSPDSIAERMAPEPIPVLGSQPASDVSHKPDGRLPLLSAMPAVSLATLKRAASN